MKILIVDDELDILEFLSYALRKEGFTVITANNGNEGLILAKKHKPNLIILDVMMPEKDGFEVCKEIREIKELDNSIVTFLSARSEDYSESAGYTAGADDYIFKPINPKLLISRVNFLLKSKIKQDVINTSGLRLSNFLYKYADNLSDLLFIQCVKKLSIKLLFAICVKTL